MILKPDVDYEVFMVVAEKGARDANNFIGQCQMASLRVIADVINDQCKESASSRYLIPPALACINKWLRDWTTERQHARDVTGMVGSGRFDG